MTTWALAFLLLSAARGEAVDVVLDGKPACTIVAAADPAPVRGKRRAAGDEMAATTLQEWIRKITGAELPIRRDAPAGQPAIYVGEAAVKAGLDLGGIPSPTREGLRVVADGRRVLVAGQNGTATVKAACRLLEELGCRYFMDSPLGEVYPRSTTLRIGPMDLQEKPGFRYRRIWGSQWSGRNLWKIWNGDGGDEMGMQHAWDSYVPKGAHAEHPEYFALRGGERRPGGWYCTSNRDVREVFAQGVLRAIEQGHGNPSVSPPDGNGYCECPACCAQDDPAVIEPSNGRVAVSNRYVDFISEVARRVAARQPDSLLSYYCYADYTQAPSRGMKLEPNVVAWIAPIRYCRFHRIGHPDCPSRKQLGELVTDWSRAASHIGYRTYNYNLAECLVPFSMISVWKHDIPYLKQHGCVGINLETLASWQIYGPHIWLSIRLAYDPGADADALMEDYYRRFFGPAAEPIRRYWTAVDRAYDTLATHAGSFYAVHRVWTPEFLARCTAWLDEAARLARGDEAVAARVALTREGMENARQYLTLRDALARGEAAAVQGTYQRLLQRTEAQVQAGYGNHYTPGYVKRFLGKSAEAVAAATAPPRRVVQVLPDRWRLAYDEQDRGVGQGYATVALDDSAWRQVATYSDPLDAQGLPDRRTILWYRTSIDVPQLRGKPALLFIEIDGDSTVFVNGQEVGTGKKRTAFTVDVAAALKPGKNLVAVRVDHSKITELFLGGILRPVWLIE